MVSGRTPIKITPAMIKRAEKLASQGLTFKQIAQSIGMAEPTLIKKRRICKELEAAIERGRLAGLTTVTNKLFEKAKRGNIAALIFYLKTRDPDHWSEKRVLELLGKGGGPIQVESMSEERAEEILHNLGEDFDDDFDGTGEAAPTGAGDEE
jgi:hypothetical protein